MKENLILKPDFDKLSRKEKRIAICKDVIERININLIKPFGGAFWYNAGSLRTTSASPKDVMNEKTCTVCAKGALFCSWVGNFNEVEWTAAAKKSLEEVDKLKWVAPELVNIFGREMLDNIEAAFEGTTYPWHNNRTLAESYTEKFHGYDEDADDYNQHVLKSIMQTIIDNDGEFPEP